MAIPIIERTDIRPECWYYLDADSLRYNDERVLPAEIEGLVILCAPGMGEKLEARGWGVMQPPSPS